MDFAPLETDEEPDLMVAYRKMIASLNYTRAFPMSNTSNNSNSNSNLNSNTNTLNSLNAFNALNNTGGQYNNTGTLSYTGPSMHTGEFINTNSTVGQDLGSPFQNSKDLGLTFQTFSPALGSTFQHATNFSPDLGSTFQNSLPIISSTPKEHSVPNNSEELSFSKSASYVTENNIEYENNFHREKAAKTVYPSIILGYDSTKGTNGERREKGIKGIKGAKGSGSETRGKGLNSLQNLKNGFSLSLPAPASRPMIRNFIEGEGNNERNGVGKGVGKGVRKRVGNEGSEMDVYDIMSSLNPFGEDLVSVLCSC